MNRIAGSCVSMDIPSPSPFQKLDEVMPTMVWMPTTIHCCGRPCAALVCQSSHAADRHHRHPSSPSSSSRDDDEAIQLSNAHVRVFTAWEGL